MEKANKNTHLKHFTNNGRPTNNKVHKSTLDSGSPNM